CSTPLAAAALISCALPRVRSCSRTPAARRLGFFSFYPPSTTALHTLSLHDALPICRVPVPRPLPALVRTRTAAGTPAVRGAVGLDRKSTRLNSSHGSISYAVFCLKKKTTASSRVRASPTRSTGSASPTAATTPPRHP